VGGVDFGAVGWVGVAVKGTVARDLLASLSAVAYCVSFHSPQ
jgi:hypothetical protein